MPRYNSFRNSLNKKSTSHYYIYSDDNQFIALKQELEAMRKTVSLLVVITHVLVNKNDMKID